MSRRVVLLTVPVAALGLVFAIALARELLVSRPLPAPPAPRASQPSPTSGAAPVPDRGLAADLSAYSMISARSLFNPGRSETSVVASAKPAGRPILHGVVLDGPRSRAYLEDSLVKGVFGYTVGDTVGPGQIKTISADRIMITGPEGTFEVLLNDPAKPKPPAAGVSPAPGAPRPPGVPGAPSAPAAPVPPAPAVRRVIPGPAPSQPPGPPRSSGARGQSSGAGNRSDDDDD